MQSQGSPKDTLINMRINRSKRDYIDRAAQSLGKARSDFMVEAAYEKAEEVLSDQAVFVLNDEQWEAFNQMLDKPVEASEKLRKILSTSAPWE